MSYEEYVKAYCENCKYKECIRIPLDKNGDLIDKINPIPCNNFEPE